MADIKVTGLTAITPPLDDGSVFLVSSYDGVSAYTSEKLTKAELKTELNSRPYNSYTAIVNQSGTSAPTVTVLENTLGGTPAWARTGTGTFTITLAGAFTYGKVAILDSNGSSVCILQFDMQTSAPNVIDLVTGNSNGAATDGRLTDTTVEIRVYP